MRNDREREVLIAPDGYRIYAICNRSLTRSPRMYNADEALYAVANVRKIGYRAMIYASRVINGEEHLASVTEMEISQCGSNSTEI